LSGAHAAVFLDRDGTINEEVNFVRRAEQLVLIPGAAGAIRALNERGFLVCVISNQSGIARGFLTEDDLAPIHAHLREELSLAGAHVDRIAYCPHHPTEGMPPYNVTCRCRKPAPGMLEDAARELDIDLTRSFLVGDRLADIAAGKTAGTTAILVLTGYGRQAIAGLDGEGTVPPDCIAEDLTAAVEFIIQQTSGSTTQHD
jgi:D-glycero-D-manno-heptose 1,7-bisphosphate phosphatase